MMNFKNNMRKLFLNFFSPWTLLCLNGILQNSDKSSLFPDMLSIFKPPQRGKGKSYSPGFTGWGNETRRGGEDRCQCKARGLQQGNVRDGE